MVFASIIPFLYIEKVEKKKRRGMKVIIFYCSQAIFFLLQHYEGVFYNGDIFFLPISSIVTAQGTLNNSK